MKIDDYEYKRKPIETIKNWSIHSLEDNKEGVDKYVYDMKDSYVHNFLPHLKPLRYDKFYPNKNAKESETDGMNRECGGDERYKESEGMMMGKGKDDSIALEDPQMKTIDTSLQERALNAKTGRCDLEDCKDQQKDKACPYGTMPRNHHHKHFVLNTSRNYLPIDMNKQRSKTNFGDLAKSSILKPIHQCNRLSIQENRSPMKKYKEDYSNRYSILRASIDETNRIATETYKESPLGFTVRNVPKVPTRSDASPSNTFRLFDERMKTSVINGSYVEENDKLTKCLNDYDSLRNFPKISALMNQNQIRNVHYRVLGKCMGEKYNPSNYNLDIMKSTVKRNEIGTKLH